jgi:hypothetical protein
MRFQVNDMWAAIDAIVDPNPSMQYTVRERGEPKEQPPPITKSLDGRARRWMVDPDWLKANPAFDMQKRIADNGKAWNDAVDPEDMEELFKRNAAEKADIKRGKKRTSDEMGEAKSSRNKGKGKQVAKKKTRDGPSTSKNASETVEGITDESDVGFT